ncbi:hypothetical protein LJR084_002745 [Variovorax sp. LjRoot84]|uniref:hypothetical protein n=1 Tax=Variovorax sp. LjRoot84 TaxID=3342340 RepID=UPI003ECCB703
MSTSLTTSHQNERWELGDQVWSRNPTTGAFDLADYRGLGAAPATFNPLDLATLVGARVSFDEADRGGKPVALYPGAFKFSPITGRALPEPPIAHLDTWLPPFGGDGSAADQPQGLGRTAVRLALRPSLSVESLPDRHLGMPPAGNYQFLVSTCHACESGLFALDASRGLIYHWLPHSECWLEVYPRGAEILVESSLDDHAWGMVVKDPQGSTKLFMPTEDGLAIVTVNPVARTYESQLVGRRCAGAPVMWQGRVYVPMLEEDRKLGVYALNPKGSALRRVHGPKVAAATATAAWFRPLADRRQIIWMTSMGQLIVKRGSGTALETSFLPWASGITPRFDLGSPYLSDSGHLWQQCLLQDEQGGQIVFVQLGLSEPEIRPASSPRLCTGAACFQLATRLRGDPWLDPDDDSPVASADEVIFPLLASTSASTLLCARVSNTRSVDDLFASNETYTTTFELRGEHDVQFWVDRMPRPWATRPFVYSGHLYLYHPDKRRSPGWRIDS